MRVAQCVVTGRGYHRRRSLVLGRFISNKRGTQILFTPSGKIKEMSLFFLQTVVQKSSMSQPNAEEEVVSFPKPKVVAMYNNNMGGVDQSDQIRSYYPTGRASRKWYRYIFWFLFDVAIGNAFVLDKISATGRRRPKKGLEFRDHLAKQLIGSYVGRADVRRRESQKRALTVDISPENAAHHFIAKIA